MSDLLPIIQQGVKDMETIETLLGNKGRFVGDMVHICIHDLAECIRNTTSTGWRDISTAPKDGTELIFWISSEKGFPDQTSNFFYIDLEGPHKPFKSVWPDGSGWYWSESETKLKRPDLVKGWQIYPQPPETA